MPSLKQRTGESACRLMARGRPGGWSAGLRGQECEARAGGYESASGRANTPALFLKEPLMSAIPFALAGTGYGLIGILVIILLVVLILKVL
jgi:hypothetical protein